MKKIFVPLAVALIFGAAYLLFFSSGQVKQTVPTEANNEVNATDTENADTKTKLIIGDPDAPVTLIEYADFKCSACGFFHQEAGKDIRREYIDTGRANIEFRAYPVIGPDSGRALRGAYCANDQGKFTEYHDAVFNHMWDEYYSRHKQAYLEEILTVQLLSDIAGQQGADKDKFRDCIEATHMNKHIDRDLLLAADDRVQGTPTFKVNSQRIVGPQPFSVFRTLLDIQLR